MARCSTHVVFPEIQADELHASANGQAKCHRSRSWLYLNLWGRRRESNPLHRGQGLLPFQPCRAPFQCFPCGQPPKCRVEVRQPPIALCSIGLIPMMALPQPELRPRVRMFTYSGGKGSVPIVSLCQSGENFVNFYCFLFRIMAAASLASSLLMAFCSFLSSSL